MREATRGGKRELTTIAIAYAFALSRMFAVANAEVRCPIPCDMGPKLAGTKLDLWKAKFGFRCFDCSNGTGLPRVNN